MTSAFIQQCRSKHFLLGQSERDNNLIAKTLSKSILDEVESPDTAAQKIRGSNPTRHTIKSSISTRSFLIPSNSNFVQDDVRNGLTSIETTFDFIVMDPPWWNKYIRRVVRATTVASSPSSSSSGYQMLCKEDILSMPIERLVHRTNGLVAIWCTNSPSHIADIHSELLPKWNLKLLTIWFWIKITTSGETVCDFGLPLQKQPFEQLFIACHKDAAAEKFDDLRRNGRRYLFSVPSAIHSHKPPIFEMFKNYLTPAAAEPKCLEIFARYLQPNFTSIGLEVLKLQNIKLFNEVG